MLKAHTLTASRLIRSSLATPLFRPRAGPLFCRHIKGQSKLVLVLGDNATGKSFFRRIVSLVCHIRCVPKVETIFLSMAERCASYDRIVSSMIYGDEWSNATGANSGKTILTALRTARGRTSPHVLFFDEPDTGLSDPFAASAGRYIAEFANEECAQTKAIFVVTHRKRLVQMIRQQVVPHVLLFGKDGPRTLSEWFSAQHSEADLKDLDTRGLELYRKLVPLIKEPR